MRRALWFIFGILKGQNIILLSHFIFGSTSQSGSHLYIQFFQLFHFSDQPIELLKEFCTVKLSNSKYISCLGAAFFCFPKY